MLTLAVNIIQWQHNESHWIPAFAGMTIEKPVVANSVIPAYDGKTIKKPTTLKTVIPAKAGIHAHAGSKYHSAAAQRKPLDTGLRRDDD